MRAMRCVLAGVLAAAIVTAVAAQPGGFGGFGGAQDVNTLVLTNAALQDELKVTADQKAKLKPLAEKQAEQAKASRELFAKGFKNIDKEAATEMFEKGQKLNEEVKKAVEDTLTADQKKRLHQIAIQVMDFQVFNDPDAQPGKGGGKGGKGGGFGGFATEAQKAVMKEVADALKLTDKQKSTVKGVVEEFNKERREINTEAGIGGFGGGKGGGKADPEKVEAANKKIDKLRKESWAKIQEALDDTQKTAWKGLVGEPFDTSKLRTPAPKKD